MSAAGVLSNSALPSALAAQELRTRRSVRKSLVEFSRFTLPRYQANWHHDLVGSILEKVCWGMPDYRRVIIQEPPRHGKSEQGSVRFPAFYLGHHPQNQVIHTSYALSLVQGFSNAIRGVIRGEAYQRLWPHRLDIDKETLWRLVGKEDGRPNYIAAGVGGPITGEGANLLIIDDPFKNAEEASSVTIRNKVWDWWLSTARTRLQPNGAVVIFLTRWHRDDLAGRLLDQAKHDPNADQWLRVNLPAVNENREAEPEFIGSYKALWPTMYSETELASIRASVGSRVWRSLYQGHPTQEDGNIIKRNWLRFYFRKDRPAIFDQILLSWDMAFKDTSDSSFVVGQAWGVLGAKKYLLQQVRERLDYAMTKRAFRQQAVDFPAAFPKLVEDKANGPAIISDLKNDIPGIIAVEPTGSKEARLQAASVDFEAGDVLLPSPLEEPWIEDYIDELCGFPEGAFFSDQCDATSQALNRLRMGAKTMITNVRM